MSNTPTPSPVQTPDPASSGDQSSMDRLANLHRMSRTAGVGSNDYTEVNVLSVVAVILGGLTFLTVFGSVFFVIALAAVVCAGVAIKQILSSNGTQTGLPVAMLGLLLTLLFGGMQGFKIYKETSQYNMDKSDLMQLTDSFSKKLASGDIKGAYDACFDQRLKERVPLEKLQQYVVSVNTYAGKLTRVTTNEQFRTGNAEEGVRTAQTQMLVYTAKSEPNPVRRYDLYFRSVNDHWSIYDVPEWFPAPQKNSEADPSGPAAPISPAQPQSLPIAPAGPMMPGK